MDKKEVITAIFLFLLSAGSMFAIVSFADLDAALEEYEYNHSVE